MTPHDLDDILATFADRTPAAGPARVLAIDGPSGSGKTTLAGRITERAASDRIDLPVIHMDDIYPGWDGLAESTRLLTDGVLRPLHEGRPAAYRRWDWHRDVWADERPVPPTEQLIVEGVGSGGLTGAPYLTMLLWVDAPRDIRMARGIARDGETYRPHWLRWQAQEKALFSAERTRERADLRIDGAPTLAHDPETQAVVTD